MITRRIRSIVSINSSRYCVVPDFYSLSLRGLPILFVFFSVRPCLSIRLFIVSYRIFYSLSLYVVFFVSLIGLYRIFSSLFTSCSSFDRIYLFVSLSCRTGSFPLSLSVVPILFLFFFFLLLLLFLRSWDL